LFSMTHFEKGEETILTVNPECWQLNASITSDPALDWERRFGDFTGDLNQLRIRIIPDVIEGIAELKAGRVDIEGVTSDRIIRNELIIDTDFEVQSETQFFFGFFGYNMRPIRPDIGSPFAAPGDPSMSVGLAIRKAISYAANIEEMNNIVHGGEYTLIHHPIYAKLGIWCNPNVGGESTSAGFNWIYSISGIITLFGIAIIIKKKKDFSSQEF